MAKAKVVHGEVEYLLKLDEKEARYLRGVLQNPITANDSTESTIDSELRAAIWGVLNGAIGAGVQITDRGPVTRGNDGY